MTRRISGSQDITLSYDAESRLTGVSGGMTASYVYDGDGQRVKATVSGITTVYVGSYYEVDNSVVKKYYYAGGVRIAENNGGTLYWLLGDHLSSTAVTTNGNGDYVTELRYYAWGDMRYNPGSQMTSYRFTGQRWDSGSGLYYYGARWYDPLIGRFIQADTIVPELGNPQALNRYTYTYNNPLKYTDPSGHEPIVGWLKRLAEIMNFVVTHTEISPGSKPVSEVSPERQKMAKTASAIAVTADTVATGFSGAGALLELVLAVAGSVDPLPIEEAGGLAIYYAYINPFENGASLVGTAATWASDLAAENSQYRKTRF